MTQEEALEMQQAFLDYGNEQINKVSQPQFTFTLDMANIFAIPEFKDKLDKFSLFNYIMVSIRDDYNIKAKILSFNINFEDKKDFSVTFGSIYKYKNSDIFSTAVDAMATASSASTSVSFNKFQWNNASDDSLNIKDMISSGLISAGANIVNSKSTMEIDERGLFMNNDSESSYPNDRAALTGSNLLFTSDGWKTVRTALGRFSYTKSNGTVVNTYGLISDTVLAGYVGGSLIEGSTITGNTISGGTITGTSINNGNGTFSVDANGNMTANSATIKGSITSSTITSTSINNGNGTFSVDANGVLTAKSANITGTINSTSGSIGGWTIIGNSIYNGIPYTGAKDSNSTGMGTYGGNWAFWAGNGKFSVEQSGKLRASDAEIEGQVTATSGSFKGKIEATSGTFNGTVNATSGVFDNVTINSTCTVAGQSISGTIGNSVNWNGSAIGDDYLSGISGSKVGSGFNANNIGSGTVQVAYSFGGTVIGSSDFSSGATARFTSGMYTHSITPQANYSYNIGSSGMRYSGIYASKLYGTLDSTSSRKQKTNIVDFDIEKALDIISNTKIVSYNYKTDVADNSERLSIKKKELEDYINLVESLEDDVKPTKENYEQVINTFNQEIVDIEHERERSPEKRYGFISEDAPWELVSMNRETVDTYSAVAMCFAAIQVMDKRICELENKVKELEMKGNTNNG